MLQERVQGHEYDELIDELIDALRERYGGRLIVHWEDFGVRNSFRLLDKYTSQVSCCEQQRCLRHFTAITSPYVLCAVANIAINVVSKGLRAKVQLMLLGTCATLQC